MRLHFFNSAAIANSKMDYCWNLYEVSEFKRAEFVKQSPFPNPSAYLC